MSANLFITFSGQCIVHTLPAPIAAWQASSTQVSAGMGTFYGQGTYQPDLDRFLLTAIFLVGLLLLPMHCGFWERQEE